MAKYLVPNEDGVLVPSEVPEIIPLSPQEKLIALAINTGGSGEGMSHYSQASRCGRRARLSTERYQHFKEQEASLPPTKNHFVVGSVYHKLHELARRPKEEVVTLDMDEQFQNPSVAEGVRLYKGWLNHWGLDYWGKCLAVEAHLNDDVTFSKPSEDIAQANGAFRLPPEAINVTGAIDMVVEMDAAACDRAKRRGLDLQPGRYLIDWKTADAPSDGTNYREGLQALWYPYLWNLHHPEHAVEGTIFDVVYKRSRRKDRSVLADDFGAFYVPYGMESVDSLRGMVLQGHRNVVEDVPNRSECCDWRGQLCPFRVNGDCNPSN